MFAPEAIVLEAEDVEHALRFQRVGGFLEDFCLRGQKWNVVCCILHDIKLSVLVLDI
jgi:hypothetical protein